MKVRRMDWRSADGLLQQRNVWVFDGSRFSPVILDQIRKIMEHLLSSDMVGVLRVLTDLSDHCSLNLLQ